MLGSSRRGRVLGRPELRFVNRVDELEAARRFEASLDAAESGVLVVHGVGGIGKTRFVKELIQSRSEGSAVAEVDFYLHALRGFDSGLLMIRSQLGEVLGRAAFPAFDLSFTHYWQATNPGKVVGDVALPLIENSEVLTDLVDAFADIPLLGGFVATAKLGAKTHAAVVARRVASDPLVAEALGLPPAELARALPELLAYDLSKLDFPARPMVVIDSFEALRAERPHVDGLPASDWLETLMSTAPGLLWVVISRDRLDWTSADAVGTPAPLRIESLALEPLADGHIAQILDQHGVPDSEGRSEVLSSSRGYPSFVEVWLESWRLGDGTPESGSRPEAHERLVARLLGHLDLAEQTALTALAELDAFDQRWVDDIGRLVQLPPAHASLERFAQRSICRQVEPGVLCIEPSVAAMLRQWRRVGESLHEKRSLARLSFDRLRELNGDDPSTAWVILQSASLAVESGTFATELLDRLVELSDSSSTIVSAEQQLRAIVDSPDRRDGEALLAVQAARVRILRRLGALSAALELEDPTDDRSAAGARLTFELAETNREIGRPEEAAALYRRVLHVERASGRLQLLARFALADRMSVLGLHHSALVALRDSTPVDETTRGLRLRLQGQAIRASGASRRSALERFRRALRVFERTGDHYNVARCRADIADLLAHSHPAVAAAHASRAAEEQERLNAPVERGKALTYLGAALCRLGRDEDGFKTFYEAELVLESAGYQSGLDRLALARASAAIADDDTAVAVALAREAFSSVERRNSHRLIATLAFAIIRHFDRPTDEEREQWVAMTADAEHLPGTETIDGVPSAYYSMIGIDPRWPSNTDAT